MVSSLLVDTLRDPTNSLLELYDAHASVDDFPTVVFRHFSDTFKAAVAFQEIPRLCVSNPPEAYSDRSLVRFRAMVQDTSFSQELYLANRGDGRCGGWGLVDNTPLDSVGLECTQLRECTVVWAISVPGESTWCSREIDDADDASFSHVHHPVQPHKFPAPGTPHIGVQVKLYDQNRAELLRSTDVLTFVGILTSEPLPSDLNTTIKVPTLHVLFSQPHPTTLMPRGYPVSGDMLGLREDLITWIAEEGLDGDRDAAEWVLLASIARVQSRTPPILPPSLTLSHFPLPAGRSVTPTLFHVLSELLPITSLLSLSLDGLNSDAFAPESKDEDLHSGYLQVPAGASFLVTESGVQEGKLFERGITNLRAIQEAMSSQTISYVFPYSQFSFPMDVTFVVLSPGQKSALFQTSVIVPMQTALSSHVYKGRDGIKLPPAEKLAAFRQLVGGAKSGNVYVEEATSLHIQADFVRERQESESMSADDLILRMTIARLIALSGHQKEVTVDIWDQAKKLDTRRRARGA